MPNISEYMDKEHEELDELWLCFLETVEKSEDWNKMEHFFNEFNDAFKKHMRLEDDFLFPRLYAALGFDKNSAIAQQAQKDHQGLLTLLALSKESFLKKDKAKILFSGNNLSRALKTHHAREDEIQYPVSDKFISADEWAQILAELR